MSTTRRVPVPPALLAGGPGSLTLPKEVSHYVRDVLRLRGGAALQLFDGAGRRGRAVLGDDGITVVLEVVEDAPAVDGPAVTLLCALSKGDKLDTVVEKATEAGAYAVWPVVAERSVVQLKDERVAGRLERWRRVADAAARQCGRDHGLVVRPPMALDQALEECAGIAARRWLHPGGEVLSRTLSGDEPAVVLATGPEGGWTAEETARALRGGFVLAGLGPTVLRAETAPLVGLAVTLARAGRL